MSRNVLRWPAVIFDLDDTLFPERDYVLSGFSAVSNWIGARFGADVMHVNKILSELFNSGIRGNTFDRLLVELDLAGQVDIRDMVKVYRSHDPDIRCYEWALPLLKELRAAGATIGLISDGYLEVQTRKWNALNLDSFFDQVLFTDKLGREFWKPSIVPFNTMLERMGADASDAVYIADNPLKDFKGPNTIGMATIQHVAASGEYSSMRLTDSSYEAALVIDNDPIKLRRALLSI
jgi:putative hydrolase of the HAD superfamily